MEYSEFLAGLEPVILGVDSASFTLDRSAYWSPPKNSRRVLSSKYTLADVSDDYFDIEATFSVALQASENDGPVVQALKIECVFRGHFHAEGPIDREHAEKFTESDSWLVFWPFFRQFVSDTTARMAIPPIIVPMALGPGEYSYRRRTEEIPHKKVDKAAPKRVTAPKKRISKSAQS